jgi:DNA-binding XRE family transcriptional regulator
MTYTIDEPRTLHVRQKNYPVMSSDELRAAREELGWTQQEAAERYEISLDGYKKYELGLRPIPGPVKLLTGFFLEQRRKK